MKNISLTLLIALCSLLTNAQDIPENINYQSLIRNNDGSYVNNQDVSLKATIIKDSPDGNAIYTETHATQTNDYGLVNLKIGSGVTNDNFSEINWSSGPYFLKIEVSVGSSGIYDEVGIVPFSSVPYALYAKDADVKLTSGEGIEIINKTISAKHQEALWNANTIQNERVSEVEPMIGDVLVYDGTQWKPGKNNLPPGSGILSLDPNAPDGYLFSGNTLMSKKISGEWDYAESMNYGRRYVATCECDGKLYVFGGEDQSSFGINYVEEYDPSTNSWTTLNSMPNKRVHAAATELNGLIYLAGGFEQFSHDASKTIDVFNPETGNWSNIPSMNYGRWGLGLFSFNNKLYAVGGLAHISSNDIILSIEEFDFNTNTWTVIQSIPEVIRGTKCTIIGNTIYLVEGSKTENNLNTYSYNIETQEWNTHPNFSDSRVDFAIGTIGNNIIITGGLDKNNNKIDITELFLIENNQWITIDANLKGAVYGSRGSKVGDNFIITGGVDVNNIKTNAVQMFTLKEIEELIYFHTNQ